MRLSQILLVGAAVVAGAVGRPAGAASQATEVRSLSFAKEYVFYAEILNEERTYWVSLPTSYENPTFGPEDYPVIYAVDGISVFFPLAGLVNFMSGWENVNYQIPEAIVVGIATPNRTRDLTPTGGEQFLEFLIQELFPIIEAEYRTLPYRAYVGHSLGGFTSTYTLLNHPGVFNGYLAIDPSLWWDSAAVVRESPELLEAFDTETVQRYYLTVIDTANTPAEASLHINSILELGDDLADRAPTNLKWNLEVFANTDHSSIPLLSWYNGLQFLFEGFDLNHYGLMQNPEQIEPHFDRLADNTGLRMPPPQTIFHILSHYLTTANRFPDAEKAFYVINMGLKYHPRASFLHEKLGAAYEMIDEPQKALESYETALQLNPENRELKEKITRLRQ
jgi:predicted alpha/beta superfamily hydrolase